MNVGLEVSLEPCEVRAKMGTRQLELGNFCLVQEKLGIQARLYI